ncbi:protein-L-isoaspartate O-methyltransferase family protein [Consotaella aegiceratis]|uniref:protein-L-isoaspartate O-methyltransferase family protein n=1 Tax=Consotaella aegiceratis TaxID=3097961 RepID=UPI002F3ECC21
MTEEELLIVRRAFARQMLGLAGATDNRRLEEAFAAVRRERFLGSDPWQISDIAAGGARPLPANDPVYVYQDVLFALSPSRGVNNGGPSLHARLLHALAPEPGQTVIHLGAGTGYYSAILAHLVGPRGRVVAVEIDPVFGHIAKAALADLANVEVIVGDAARWPEVEATRIYVNFAVSAPPPAWIENLAPGGRLVLPLGVPGEPMRPAGPRFSRHGGAFLIERANEGFRAAHICPAYFIHAEGPAGRDSEEAVERLRNAFRARTVEFVQSLVWKQRADPNRCWLWSPDWSLSYDPVS